MLNLDLIAMRESDMRGLPLDSAYARAIDLGGILGDALSGDPETEMEASRAIGRAFLAHKESIDAARIARIFSALLHDRLGPAIMAEINRQNRARCWPSGACASHDACDSNVLMGTAFEIALDRPARPDSQSDADLWSRAWDMAVMRGFPAH